MALLYLCMFGSAWSPSLIFRMIHLYETQNMLLPYLFLASLEYLCLWYFCVSSSFLEPFLSWSLCQTLFHNHDVVKQVSSVLYNYVWVEFHVFICPLIRLYFLTSQCLLFVWQPSFFIIVCYGNIVLIKGEMQQLYVSSLLFPYLDQLSALKACIQVNVMTRANISVIYYLHS